MSINERATDNTNCIQCSTFSDNAKVHVGNNNYMLNSPDNECMRHLFDTDPRDDKERIRNTKGGLLRDSYRWILDNSEFRRWREDPQSRLLWIKGDPGKGKTMLLCGIIDELSRDHTNEPSYFFCQATSTRLNNATAVLRGLVWFLATQYQNLVEYIRREYDSKGDRLLVVNPWETLSRILEAMLQDERVKDTTIVIDALDECDVGRPKLLEFIIKSSSSYRPKWIVSSRNSLEVNEGLGNRQGNILLSLELNEALVSDAVQSYIRYKVRSLANAKKYDDDTRKAVEEYLKSNSHGTFFWVALVCQQLADPTVRKRHTLTKPRSYPPGLDGVYDWMMRQIRYSEDADLCKQILAIASVVYRPVTVRELGSLLQPPHDFDYTDLQDLTKSCGSFLTPRQDIVYFVHQSAKDFLLKTASHDIIPFGLANKHHNIFSRSLQALSETLRRDIYNLSALGFPID